MGRQKQPTWVADPTGQGRFEAWIAPNKKVADIADTVTRTKHTVLTKKDVLKFKALILELLQNDIQEFQGMDQAAMKELVELLAYLQDAMVE